MSIDTPAGWTHESVTTIAASADQVYAALTEPAQLTQWFAEHVDVSLHVGGKYHFWGHSSYQAPSHREATQVITRLVPGTTLGFSWRLNDAESDATLEIVPIDNARCKLKVTHLFAAPQDRELIQDLWRVISGNLYAWLNGGHGLLLPDFTATSREVRLSIMIDAGPERVFALLTDPAQMPSWLGDSAPVVDLKEGGQYSYGWRYTVDGRDVAGGPTRILELTTNRKLVTDWPDWRGHPDRPPTQVAWLLEPVGSGTRLSLIHSGFAAPTDMGDYGSGWWYYLDIMQRLLAAPKEES